MLYASVCIRSPKSGQYLIKFGEHSMDFRDESVNNLLLVLLVEISET